MRAMPSDLDIYRSAHALIQQHGGAAAIEAAMKTDAMLDKGDLNGAAVNASLPYPCSTFLSAYTLRQGALNVRHREAPRYPFLGPASQNLIDSFS